MGNFIRTMTSGSLEYIDAEVTSTADLTNQAVKFSFDLGQTWVTGAWETAGSVHDAVKGVYTRKAQYLYTAGAVGEYPVWVQVIDTPEHPVLPAGALVVES